MIAIPQFSTGTLPDTFFWVVVFPGEGVKEGEKCFPIFFVLFCFNINVNTGEMILSYRL